jgi:hypothetical protein
MSFYSVADILRDIGELGPSPSPQPTCPSMPSDFVNTTFMRPAPFLDNMDEGGHTQLIGPDDQHPPESHALFSNLPSEPTSDTVNSVDSASNTVRRVGNNQITAAPELQK